MARKRDAYKLLFFDRPGVMSALDKKRRRVLARIGGAGRKAMRGLFKPRGKPRIEIEALADDDGNALYIDAATNAVRYADSGRFAPKALADRVRAKVAKQATKKISSGGSRPGQPPRVSPGSPLKSLVFFAYDQSAQSVVYGPLPFKPSNTVSLHGAASVAELLDVGGVETIVNRTGDKTRIRIAARPYRAPAEAIVAPIAAKIIASEKLKK